VTGADHERTAQAFSARPNWRALAQSGVLLRFVFLGLGIWLHAADELIISTLITDIVGDIGGIELLGWNLALYELGSILAGAAMGLQIARSGLRTGFAMSALVYAAGCAISALAPAMEIMLLGRRWHKGLAVAVWWLLRSLQLKSCSTDPSGRNCLRCCRPSGGYRHSWAR
jgi:MFS family permease